MMEAFHETPWPNRLAIVENFQDPRLRTIGLQLIHIERPELLAPKTRRDLDLACAKRVLGHGDDIQWLTIPAALSEIEAMSRGLIGADLQHLKEHESYLRSQHNVALASLEL